MSAKERYILYLLAHKSSAVLEEVSEIQIHSTWLESDSVTAELQCKAGHTRPAKECCAGQRRIVDRQHFGRSESRFLSVFNIMGPK